MRILFLAILISFTLTSIPAFAIQEDPLNIAPASQAKLQNTQGEVINQVLVDEQILIVADVTNALDTELQFVYIVQIQNQDRVVVSLGWIEGSLSPNQRLSPALSWIPQNQGTYTVTVFVWEAINNPSALSHTLDMQIDVKLAEI